MTPPNLYLARLLVDARQRDLGAVAPLGRRRLPGRMQAGAHDRRRIAGGIAQPSLDLGRSGSPGPGQVLEHLVH